MPKLARLVLAATLLAASVGRADTESRDVPEAALVTLAGEPVVLKSLLAGQPAVLNLWATWCPPCREEMPMLAAAQVREAGRVRFVFADQGEGADAVRRYLDDEILSLDHVLLDARSSLRRAAGARGLPTTLFYDGHGRLVARHVGPLSRDELAHRLEALRGQP